MQEMSNLDYYYSLRELRSAVGSHLEQVYELSRNIFRFRFKFKGFDKSLLVDLNASRMHFAKEFSEPPRFPSSFAMFLRKHFKGRRLDSIEQLNFDRIIKLGFGDSFIILEAFKSGNILALDAEERIMLPYHPEEYSARKLAKGVLYSPPPQSKPIELNVGEFRGNYKVVSVLSKRVALAPFYLEEVCALAGVDLSTRACNVTREQKARLVELIPGLLEQEFSPRVYSGGRAFAPFALEKAGSEPFEQFESFGEALESYYGPLPEDAAPPLEGKRDRALKQQENAIVDYSSKAGSAAANAAWINENYGLVEELLGLARSHDSKALSEKARANNLEFELNGKKLILRDVG